MSPFGVLEFRSASVYPDIVCTHGPLDPEIQFINRVRRRKICTLGEENVQSLPPTPQGRVFVILEFVCYVITHLSHCTVQISFRQVKKNSINIWIFSREVSGWVWCRG